MFAGRERASKLIQPHQARAYAHRMSPEPTSAHPYASLSLAQMIGLNLAKLYAWLVRFEASGETKVPSDIAQMVTSTDWLVHAFIRMLASEQLDRAGFTFAALAMRDPVAQRIEKTSGRHERGEGAAGRPRTGSGGGTLASKQNEPAQSCAPLSPTEVLARLETTMENFDRAEAIASTLARVIVFTLVYVSSGTPDTIGAASTANRREIKMISMAGVRPQLRSASRRDPPDPWPPPNRASSVTPYPPIPVKTGIHASNS